MVNRTLGHEVISASAGSGKTFQLVNRFIALLAAGTDPTGIMALTFSRAAAGEILEKIVLRLAWAGLEVDGPRRLEDDLHSSGYPCPTLDQQAVARLLRSLVDELHRLRIGTIDSFFVQMLRLFPREFGVLGEPGILDAYRETRIRARILQRVLAAPDLAAARLDLVEGYKQAGFGEAVKRFADSLAEQVSDLHGLVLDLPDPLAWGHDERIWPRGSKWSFYKTVDLEYELDRLPDLVAACCTKAGQEVHWLELAEALRGFRPGSRLPGDRPGRLLDKLFELLPDLGNGLGRVVVDRKAIDLSPEVCELLDRILGHLIWCVLEAHLARTRGLYRMIAAYEGVYDREVRRMGSLSFQDVTFLVSNPERNPEQAYVEYRLDGAIDHWLLDEFQDTSTPQWQALSNLVDEVMQDLGSGRTFFYVGDVKQAIYNWRGGNPGLFTEVLEAYGRDRFIQRPLARSYRSCPQVIDAVNRTFGDLSGFEGIPEQARARWADLWTEHSTARQDLAGFVGLYQLEAMKGRSQEEGLARFELAADLLEKISPHTRGLTAAVLVRKNSSGQEMLSILRNRGIPAVWAGEEGLGDDPLVSGLLSLLKLAAHPGDTFSRRHLEMLPLARLLERELGPSWSGLSALVLGDLSEKGYEAALARWVDLILEENPDLDTTLARVLLDGARAFDLAGGGPVLEFCDFIAGYTTRGPVEADKVQVMTMHRSKGLQFDLVILPELQARSGGADQFLFGPRRSPGSPRTWILSRPPKAVARHDPMLKRAMEQREAEEWFEQLCLLYVAMTRAQKGLYLITTERGGDTLNPAGIVEARLQASGRGAASPAAALGDEDWFRSWSRGEDDLPAAPTRAERASLRTGSMPNKRILPSGNRGFRGFGGAESRALGVAVHRLLEQVEFLGPGGAEPGELPSAQVGSLSEHQTRARALVSSFLARPDIQQLFAKPEGRFLLWRERSFEVIVDGTWISGTFDRVLIHLGPEGLPRSAIILDFKTGRTLGDHRAQLGLYQRALSCLTGLPISEIDARAIHVTP